MQRPRRFLLALTVTLVALPVGPVASADGDLNGDGYDDLVVGVPSENVSGVADAGSINYLRGRRLGIGAKGDKVFTQADLGGNVEAGDRFGNAIAYGDFDGDGFDDVAVGAPTENFRGRARAGVVHVIYGSNRGPRASGTDLLSQAGRMAGKNEDGDFYGAVLDSGDFNADGFDDLVIGVPGEDWRGRIAAGGIVVAYGGRAGAGARGTRFFSQAGTVPGRPHSFDAFGFALATGDVNGDGFDDVVVGTPGEDLGAAEDAGVAALLYGSANGIRPDGGVALREAGPSAVPEAGDNFGNALAVADYDNDGYADIAVGVRDEDVGGARDAGAVMVFAGGPNGPGATPTTVVGQQHLPAGANEAGDRFGYALAAGDFDHDGFADLAVGSPFEDVGAVADAGEVTIIPGSRRGISVARATAITQGPIPNASPETGDRFGEGLRVGRFDSGPHDDLVISSPFEDVGSRVDSGVIYVVYGRSDGLAPSSGRRFHQGTPGVKGRAEADDLFGIGL